MAIRLKIVDRDTPMMLVLLIYCYATGRFSSRFLKKYPGAKIANLS